MTTDSPSTIENHTTKQSTQRLAELIDREAWAELAREIGTSREPCDAWLRTLAINLDSMRTHRRELYQRVVAAIPTVSLDAAFEKSNPEVSDDRAFTVFTATKLLRQHGRSVALGGVGDGQVLRSHCRFPPKLILNRQQEVMVIEPDFAVLIAALGKTDLSGLRGAFEQMRITWFVGPNWIDELTQGLIDEPTRIVPIRVEAPGEPRQDIVDGIAEMDRRLTEVEESRREAIRQYYDALSDEELLDALGPTPSRTPRMLMLTSQFSSVLQYSTNDSADAMRQMGWDVEICTERDIWHSMGPPAVLAAIASFKPDVIYHIDHLRYEMPDTFPAKLPHVCWIQDHLANLTNDFAGKSLGDRDYALTGATYRYVTRHGYPRRQCIDMAKSSRPPVLPATWTSDREDVFYVSHWSSRAEIVVGEICLRTRDLAGAAAEKAMYECCAQMVATYTRGGSFPTMFSIKTLVQNVFRFLGLETNEQLEHFFVDALFLRLNNVLYRQQALTWTGEIADELGLKFGIYGRDWETHPMLGRFARGAIQYGPDLERLTRESKILLQLEPYACYTHQRMLDALLAGGFTVVRSHPFNYLPIKVRQFLDAYVPAEIYSVDEAMEALAPPLQEQFKSLLAESQEIAAMGDVVDVVRGWQRGGIIGNGDLVLPCLDEVSFDSKQSLRERIVRFVSDESGRRQIAATQRECVMERFTYYQTLKGAMRKVHALLADTVRSNRETDGIREAA